MSFRFCLIDDDLLFLLELVRYDSSFSMELLWLELPREE